MKGIVFTEWLDHAEATHGPAAVDRAIADANLSTHGAYTSVGTYPVEELLRLVAALAELVGTTPGQLIRSFGEHLFARFAALFPQFFVGIPTAFAFLERVDSVIHQEVRKLYPDAELPRFDVEHRSPTELVMTYRSSRPLADLAEGLIQGCARHFGAAIELSSALTQQGNGPAVCFHLTCRTPMPTATI